jgi:general secretion pathway protein N
MRHRSLLAIGAGFYLATFIAQAPATLVDAGLHAASNGQLRLARAQGTVWAGAGTIEFRDAAAGNAIAEDVSWRVLPESLWRGRLVGEVVLERAARHVRIAVSTSKVEIASGEIHLPAAALAFAEPRLKPLRLSGDVLLRVESLSVWREGMQGYVTLQWRNAGSAFSPVTPIGSYELRLDGRGNSIQAFLSTLQGPLQLEGSGTWSAGNRSDFQATVLVPPQHREQFTPLLRLISVQRDEGTFELQPK